MQMKLFTPLLHAVLIAGSTVLSLSAHANQFRFCEPGTRCSEYSDCYINDIRQPCAYGSGGARLGGLIFDHGVFYLEWVDDQHADVRYGTNKEFSAKASISIEDGYMVYRLSDGVVVKVPSHDGRRNPNWGPRPTHRPPVH